MYGSFDKERELVEIEDHEAVRNYLEGCAANRWATVEAFALGDDIEIYRITTVYHQHGLIIFDADGDRWLTTNDHLHNISAFMD